MAIMIPPLLVFDLDDTLYPELDFVKSGFLAVANLIDQQNPTPITIQLWTLFQESPKNVFDRLNQLYSTPISTEKMIEEYRFHFPTIHLDDEVKELLTHLKSKGPLALITDGHVQTQKQKYQALGLEKWIDFPVFSAQFHTQKPDPILFKKVMEEFPKYQQFVYIADNPLKDFLAPEQLGWECIRLKRAHGVYAHVAYQGRHEVETIAQLKECLEEMLSNKKNQG